MIFSAVFHTYNILKQSVQYLQAIWSVQNKAAQIGAFCFDMSFFLCKKCIFLINARLGSFERKTTHKLFLPSINTIGFQLKMETEFEENVQVGT